MELASPATWDKGISRLLPRASQGVSSVTTQRMANSALSLVPQCFPRGSLTRCEVGGGLFLS